MIFFRSLFYPTYLNWISSNELNEKLLEFMHGFAFVLFLRRSSRSHEYHASMATAGGWRTRRSVHAKSLRHCTKSTIFHFLRLVKCDLSGSSIKETRKNAGRGKGEVGRDITLARSKCPNSRIRTRIRDCLGLLLLNSRTQGI